MKLHDNTIPSYLMNCRGRLIDFSTAKIMGVINITPDSFYAKSRYQTMDLVDQMITEGVDILDLGAISTRPDAEIISAEAELNRLIPILQQIRTKYPNVMISIDTFRSTVLKEASLYGIDLVNDISAGNLDTTFLETVAELKLPYVLMHMQGNPETMQQKPSYGNVTLDIIDFFSKKITELTQLGINDIIIDPGFGFGKTVAHNFQLLKELDQFKVLQRPVLVGFSRKSMIQKVIQVTAENALNGTTVLNTIALLKKASIFRVHDVKEVKQVCQLVQQVDLFN